MAVRESATSHSSTPTGAVRYPTRVIRTQIHRRLGAAGGIALCPAARLSGRGVAQAAGARALRPGKGMPLETAKSIMEGGEDRPAGHGSFGGGGIPPLVQRDGSKPAVAEKL